MENVFHEIAPGKEPLYEVVRPLGRPTNRQIPIASPLPDLKGKTIGFAWSIFTNGEVLAESFTDLLGDRFEGIRFVKLPSGKEGKWGEYPRKDFPDVVKEAEVDALIALVGG